MIVAMSEVWSVSGLQDSFRARWRMTTPPENERLAEDDATLHFPTKLAGRSAQAATLCALLAASGNPYQEESRDVTAGVVDPLDTKIAISAKVICRSGGKATGVKPTELSVGQVGKVPAKLSSAWPALDTVSFCPLPDTADETDTQIRELMYERNKAREKGEQYAGLHIERVATVADALDLMLQTNRHLRKYQAISRDKWLGQWENDTARFDGDEADGPDRLNRPENAAQSATDSE